MTRLRNRAQVVMKMLFITNYYPPEVRGGYELWCQEVAESLANRGHEMTIVTSGADRTHHAQIGGNPRVYQSLQLEVCGGISNTVARIRRKKQTDKANGATVATIIERARPDVVLHWGMWNVPRSVPALVESLLPDRTAYYFCDYWPTLPCAYEQQLRNPARRPLARFPKRLVARLLLPRLDRGVELQFRHPICVSEAVRRLLVKGGVRVAHARVIHGGTRLHPAVPQMRRGPSLRLLYLGRIVPDKGLHTVVGAIRVLAERAVNVSLDVYGAGDVDYMQGLARTTEEARLSSAIRFRGNIPAADVPALLTKYDALVFPSEWEEPFARTVLEAMAAGLLVIGTLTGGTGDILKHKQTGLTFKAGDAMDLANQIELAAHDPELSYQLALAGKSRVSQHFTLERMVEQIEDSLRSLCSLNLVNSL